MTTPPTLKAASHSSTRPPWNFQVASRSRHTQTVPAGTDGGAKGKDIVVTDEYWYSEDLRINVVLKHSDPRTGSVIMTVTQITRTDPDSLLFQIPDGYTGPEAARLPQSVEKKP